MLHFSIVWYEWFISIFIFAPFVVVLTVVTLYATLGDDAIIHGINEAEISLIITSASLLPKLQVRNNCAINSRGKAISLVNLRCQVIYNTAHQSCLPPTAVEFLSFCNCNPW